MIDQQKSVKISYKQKLSIWSIFLVTSITGIAITPILPEIQTHFHNILRTETDLLSSLPNMIIIPFVLLSGFIVKRDSRLSMIRIGLFVFIISAIGYQFMTSFIHLLLISLILGAGVGIVIPIANSLPSDFFYGRERQRQLGICGAIADASQVICLFMTGVLYKNFGWKAPFFVYMIAVVPLVLSFLIKKKKNKTNTQNPKYGAYRFNIKMDKCGFSKKLLYALIIQYFLFVFIQFQISLNLPYLLIHYGYSETFSALSIAFFFLIQSIFGFLLMPVINILGKNVVWLSFLFNAIALILIPLFIESKIVILMALALAGIPGGTIEPLIWDKTSHICLPNKKLRVFSYVMSVNYFTIWITPLLIRGFALMFDATKMLRFSFYLAGIIAIITTIIAIIYKRDFIWGVPDKTDL